MQCPQKLCRALLAALIFFLTAEVASAGDKSPSDFIRNNDRAIELGKALFWDTQAGGDGETACGSCHYMQGRDTRVINTVHPGPDGVFEIVSGPGGALTPGVFPLSGVDDDDRVGSQGVVAATFKNIIPGNAADSCDVTGDPVFGMNRQVTGRNTPTMFLAAKNVHNFWDGRALNTFNGVSPGGDTDGDACVWVDKRGKLKCNSVSIKDSAMASQAVGPPNNEVEMSCLGRTFPELGRKMLNLKPLGDQVVASDDSVLGDLSDGTGLNKSYKKMVKAAFKKKYWSSDDPIELTAENGGTELDFNQMEANFALFWGLSIQAYVELLVPKHHDFAAGNLSKAAKRGRKLFDGKARCDKCHGGSGRQGDFTEATDGDGGDAFSNSAVRPISEDPGRAGGDGEFKTSSLLNVAQSGPYFHNGGYLTLRQVVEFYNRGGDFPGDETDSQIRELDLDSGEMDDLVEFMKALTDKNALNSAAPYDHPSIDVPNFGNIEATGKDGGADATPILGVSPNSQ